MKKKWFLIFLLAVFMSANASAFASELLPPITQPDDFVYRDGIKFGMNVDEVKAIEAKKPSEEQWIVNYESDNTYYIKYESEKTLDFSCDILYHFTSSKGELFQIQVNIYTTIHRDFDYNKLQNDYSEIDFALIHKYGAADGPTAIDAITGTVYTKQYTHWSASNERSVKIEHAILSGGTIISHSINYYLPQLVATGDI